VQQTTKLFSAEKFSRFFTKNLEVRIGVSQNTCTKAQNLRGKIIFQALCSLEQILCSKFGAVPLTDNEGLFDIP